MKSHILVLQNTMFITGTVRLTVRTRCIFPRSIFYVLQISQNECSSTLIL